MKGSLHFKIDGPQSLLPNLHIAGSSLNPSKRWEVFEPGQRYFRVSIEARLQTRDPRIEDAPHLEDDSCSAKALPKASV